ncbi:1,4-dihydroxy-2-naphthoyl-CoA synthase [Microbacterium sp. STN6]|uniref:1,4-dihydroxy-2-naphthoyl-CoA synthase n=1 Tax=Microbacterium sp. STN6 TaxID=2995588 RepID=UPI002260BBBD|nr:1,4-dihydroxy-2-naphthoyl-CoA synthase [Microbacterium sp. STN6]MCX7520685.1 1,4-dihydroxy-2-naphthoyl-CoA synthase [Microbacterium sp. STN6]
MTEQVSEIFDAGAWRDVPGFEALTDITYHQTHDGRVARVAFNRPEVRNAFRPHTVDELYAALEDARTNPRIGVVLLTGNGPSPKDGGWAFCSGGDQRIRGRNGYQYEAGEQAPGPAAEPAPEPRSGVSTSAGAQGFETRPPAAAAPQPAAAAAAPGPAAAVAPGPAAARIGRLHILEVQRLIRFMPKVVIAVVPGWAAGGGHSLHVVCDLTIASAEHARFKQTDADVGSFDAGYGSAYFARQIGQKFAREVFFLAQEYSAERAYEMGAVNAVVPHDRLEPTALEWARTILTKSPTAIRMLKFAFNAVDDGLVGQQVFAGEATRLAYGTDEAVEGRDSFLEKRDPDWSSFDWQY